MVDKILTLDNEAMMTILDNKKLPESIRNAVINSPQYKEAQQKQTEKKQIEALNAIIAGKEKTVDEAPTTTAKSVKDNLGIVDEDTIAKE